MAMSRFETQKNSYQYSTYLPGTGKKERKMVVRVGLAAEWIETWPLTERSECDNFTVHVNERLS